MFKLSRYPDQVIRIADAAAIPKDPRNVDYQAVLAWIAAGNTLAPADQADLDEGARLAAIDSTIGAFTLFGKTVPELKAMDNAALNTWWTANVTDLTKASLVLKLVFLVILRRVL